MVVGAHRLLPQGRIDFQSLQRRLNAFLERAVTVARANFEGEITYSAGPWEAEGIDWRQFDFVGLDYYAFHPTRKEHAREPKQAFVALAERYGAAR